MTRIVVGGLIYTHACKHMITLPFSVPLAGKFAEACSPRHQGVAFGVYICVCTCVCLFAFKPVNYMLKSSPLFTGHPVE